MATKRKPAPKKRAPSAVERHLERARQLEEEGRALKMDMTEDWKRVDEALERLHALAVRLRRKYGSSPV